MTTGTEVTAASEQGAAYWRGFVPVGAIVRPGMYPPSKYSLPVWPVSPVITWPAVWPRRGHHVNGVDNLNLHYDAQLKIDRLREMGVVATETESEATVPHTRRIPAYDLCGSTWSTKTAFWTPSPGAV